MKPTCYFLVGIPGSGKSTWLRKFPINWERTTVASTDNYIDSIAHEKGTTYSTEFKAHYPDAVKKMNSSVRTAIENKFDIIWDQTNTAAAARKLKLSMIPPSYRKIAVVFPTPEMTELTKRLKSRPGKDIPDDVVQSMIEKFEFPTINEGFDEVWIV